ncbi:MAG: tetratricopeptide repeat protein [Muribaculaceae bacterium]|nr:tetratricopeptide repeat protein [Muribaculaceae bacterium]
MNFRKYIVAASVGMALAVNAQSINPLTQAMLDGYETLLAENPKDYRTLYERASQYYRLSRYDLALNDIKKAIEFTPAKDKDQLSSVYGLCADIYTQMQDYSAALDAVNNALVQTPNSYPLLYMKGNICLYLNDLKAAAGCFQAMRRMNPRSQEAVIGNAIVAVRERNFGQASELLKDAERLDPSNYLTYCRIGDIHREMGMHRQAASDYISAFSLNYSSERPMSSMLSLAKENYGATVEAVDYALTQTSNTVPLNFLKANIALNAGKYAEAYEAYQQLLIDEAQTAILAPSVAKVCLGMGNIQEADKYANMALQRNNNAANNLTKAQIEESAGNIASALIYAENSLRANGDSPDAIMEVASLQTASGNFEDALRTLANALLLDPSNTNYLLLRGYIQSKCQNNAAAGNIDFQRAINASLGDDSGVAAKAIAQALSGLKLDAQSTIAPLESKAEINPETAILVAQYYKLAGNASKAAEYKAKAKAQGYEDEYIMSYSLNPILSLKGI